MAKEIPDQLLPLLSVLACTQQIVEEAVLVNVFAGSIRDLLDLAESKGLVQVQVREDTVFCQLAPSLEATLYESLVKANPLSVDEWHQKIGRRLLRAGVNERLAIDQLLRVSDWEQMQGGCHSDETRWAIADACLRTGTEAVRQHDFGLAANHLNFGTRLLSNCGPKHWDDMYELSLTVYQAAAEANLGNSDFVTAQHCIDIVKENAKSFHDTLVVLASEVMVLSANDQRQRAIDLGLAVLRKLGVRFPAAPKQRHLVINLILLHKLLWNKSNETLLGMPDMTNETIGHAMKFLQLLYSNGYTVRPILLMLIVVRMVKLTVQYGLCAVSAPAFATLGMVLGIAGKTEYALQYGQLGLELSRRFPVREWLPRTYLAAYGGVFSSLKGPSIALEPLKQAYQVGLETGDIETAFMSAHSYVYANMVLGQSLDEALKEQMEFFDEAKRRSHLFSMQVYSTTGYFLLALVGGDLEVQFRESIDSCIEGIFSDTGMQRRVHMGRMVEAYMFGDYARALQESRLCRGVEDFPSWHVAFTNVTMVHALTRTAYCLQTRQRPWRLTREIKTYLAKLKKWALLLPEIVSAKLFLVQAEVAWLRKKPHHVVQYHFQNALGCATFLCSKNSSLDVGLCHERWGNYLQHLAKQEDALRHWQSSIAAYRDSGAHAKAQQLSRQLQTWISTVRTDEEPKR